MRRIATALLFNSKVVQQYRHGWEAEAVEDVKKNPESATNGMVLRRRLQLMMYNNIYRMLFDRRFENEEDPLFVKLKALNMQRGRLAQGLDYNYGDYIPILRPFLRGYGRLRRGGSTCSRTVLLKRERVSAISFNFCILACINWEFCLYRKVVKTKDDGVKCAIDHMLEAQQKGEMKEDNILYMLENINVTALETTLWSLEWQRLQVPPLRGWAEELPWNHTCIAHTRHHVGPPRPKLRYQGEERAVQPPHFEPFHHCFEANITFKTWASKYWVFLTWADQNKIALCNINVGGKTACIMLN